MIRKIQKDTAEIILIIGTNSCLFFVLDHPKGKNNSHNYKTMLTKLHFGRYSDKQSESLGDSLQGYLSFHQNISSVFPRVLQLLVQNNGP